MLPFSQAQEDSEQDSKHSERVKKSRDYIKYATNPEPVKLVIHLDERGQAKVPENTKISEPIQQLTDYMKYVDKPEYVKLEVHLDERGIPKISTNANFKCSIGCFFGFTIQVFHANEGEILVKQSEWTANTAIIPMMIQDQKKSKAFISPAGYTTYTGEPSIALGWISPGEFNLSVTARTILGNFESQASIIVVAPIIQDLDFESPKTPEIRKHSDDTSWLEFGPIKKRCFIRTSEFPGIAGFIQLMNACHVRNSAEGTSQKLQTSQDFKTIRYIGRTTQILSCQDHLDAYDQKTFEEVHTSGVELNSSFPQCKDWTHTSKNSFKTYFAFQPDAICAPGVIKTFIVIYNSQYVNWGWSAIVVNDTNGCRLQNPESDNVIKTDSQQWHVPLWNASSFGVVNNEDWSQL